MPAGRRGGSAIPSLDRPFIRRRRFRSCAIPHKAQVRPYALCMQGPALVGAPVTGPVGVIGTWTLERPAARESWPPGVLFWPQPSSVEAVASSTHLLNLVLDCTPFAQRKTGSIIHDRQEVGDLCLKREPKLGEGRHATKMDDVFPNR